MNSGSKILLLAAPFILALSACSSSIATTTTSPTLAPTLTQQPIVATQTLISAPVVATVQLPASDAEVPRVAVAEAKAALDGGKAIIVDVRTKAAYLASHIKGALYLADIEDSQFNVTVPKNQWIITYCT